jgi:hypothetical protein
MANGWSTKRVLITVRTYPVPVHRGIEVSCTAGVTSDGNWIRLFRIPYRFLNPDQRFTKYQWIEVDATRARGDARLAELRRFDPPFRDFRRASRWAVRSVAGQNAENRL